MLTGCNKDTDCGTVVDEYLNRYCGELTFIANQATARNSTISNCSKCNQPTVTSSGINPNATAPTSPAEGQSSLMVEASSGLTSEVNNVPVVALGILLALSMVLLAAATIGWVTTYLIMKKREVAKKLTNTR